MFKLTNEQEKRALNIHHKSIVVDTHNDGIYDLVNIGPFVSGERIPSTKLAQWVSERKKYVFTLGEKGKYNQISIPRIREGGVDCLIFALYVSPLYDNRLKRLLQLYDVFLSELDKNSDQIGLATSFQEIMNITKEGKIATILSVEGGEVLEGDIGVLRVLYKLGVRSMTLLHLPRNELGDGSRDDSRSHLTEFGINVVKEMDKLGMVVDVSHINETGFWDVLENTKNPVIDSHTNCKALCNHYRNLINEQIVAIAKNGGVVN